MFLFLYKFALMLERNGTHTHIQTLFRVVVVNRRKGTRKTIISGNEDNDPDEQTFRSKKNTKK